MIIKCHMLIQCNVCSDELRNFKIKSILQELKAIVGSNKIQISFTPSTAFSNQQMKVKVNDVQRALDSNQQVVVEESGRRSATVQCDNVRCEIISEQYGVYVSINSERVQVEVSSHKADQNLQKCSKYQSASVG